MLSVVEAVTNIIRHAYQGDATQRIHLRMCDEADCVELELLDQGKNVPASALEQKPRAALEPGGLGIPLMKKCMDHFQYEPRPGGGSRLLLRKLRRPRNEEPCP